MPEADPARTRYRSRSGSKDGWEALLGVGLVQAVSQAADVAAGGPSQGGKRVSQYRYAGLRVVCEQVPVLGALAASFDLIEDPLICGRMQISVAAVNDAAKEIYIHPCAGLNGAECRFVIAHELLHVSLRHSTRCRGRDPYLWNVACDYVINGPY